MDCKKLVTKVYNIAQWTNPAIFSEIIADL